MFAEERKDIIVELSLSEVPHEGAVDTFTVAVTYIDVVRNETTTRRSVMALQRTDAVLPEGITADEEVVMHRTRLAVANRLQEAVQLADVGRYQEASNLLAEQEARLSNLVVQVRDLLQHSRRGGPTARCGGTRG
jgi:hypothetical protein